MTILTIAALPVIFLAVVVGDGSPPPSPAPRTLPLLGPDPPLEVPPPVEAFCTIQVDGIGAVETETDYLPHVITCENGGADLEALKAQAIAARSVAYYGMLVNGSICDGTGCQVYTCGATPQAEHYQAVEETAGLYLRYNGNLTYGFYVAGDPNTAPPACVGDPAAATEGYVTYNEAKTGTNVEQTTLGWVFDPNDAGYGQNRGCMSQWGSRCLEAGKGYDYQAILRFYYGDDIEVVQAQGPCVGAGGGTTGGGTTGGGTTGAGSSGSPGSTGPGGTTGGFTGGASGPWGSTSGGGTGTGGVTYGDGAGGGGTDGGDGAVLPPFYGSRGAGGCACVAHDGGGGARSPFGWLLLVAGRRRSGTDPRFRRRWTRRRRHDPT